MVSPLSFTGSLPASITSTSTVKGSPARLSASITPSKGDIRAITLPSSPVESGTMVMVRTVVQVCSVPANIAVRASSCRARLSSTSFMACPSAGIVGLTRKQLRAHVAQLEDTVGGELGSFGYRRRAYHLLSHGLTGKFSFKNRGLHGLSCGQLGIFRFLYGFSIYGQGDVVSIENHKRCRTRFELYQPAVVGIGHTACVYVHRAYLNGSRWFGYCIVYGQMTAGIVVESPGTRLVCTVCIVISTAVLGNEYTKPYSLALEAVNF